LRLTTTRAIGTSGALLSTTVLAVIPSVARSDTQQTATPTTPVATKASASLAVHRVRRDVLAGRRVLVRGVLRPAAPGRAVALQVRSPAGRWITVDRDRTNATGAYALRWRATRTGTRRLRVAIGGTRDLAATQRPLGQAHVYRRAVASWYGPGLYGGKLACGGTLTASTLGVAHKTLPCGTRVTLRNPKNGKSITVKVIDRGPYVAGRMWDLSYATCTYLGNCYTSTIQYRIR
jgi:rare lipoprotein A